MDLTTGISQLIASRVLEVPSEPVQKLRRLIAAECICNFHVHFFFWVHNIGFMEDFLCK